MIPQTPWLERTFDFSIPVGLVPDVLERLRGTPARLEERIEGVGAAALTAREGRTWSIQENAGHLLQVEALWHARLDDFVAGREELVAAAHDRTLVDKVAFNEQPLQRILDGFRQERTRLVARIESLDAAVHERRALHPRLQCRIRVLDHMLFAAEHDDHHLARVSELMRALR